ncbi:hypothetical protein ACHAWO_003466 [Cyclotella atomus]|uniref:Uncharacterized protein n=1 Tax=Cyclotella atomus TaxID=382360 RepID=A0ABD3NWD9_9STRA
MPMFKSSRAAGSSPVDKEMMILAQKKKALAAMQPAAPQRRHPSPTKRDVRQDSSRGIIDIEDREAPETSTTILQARALAAATAARPVTAPKPRTKRIITPQMVKRRNVNVRNPLVMKSDESTSGRDSAITEQTEKCSNKKDAKRRNRGYERFGTKRIEGKILEGKVLEGKTNTKPAVKSAQGAVLLPPLPPAKASSNAFPEGSENDSRAANTRGKTPHNSSDPVEPDEYEEDALLLKKRVPSGQSCSAFFLGDGSTASGISGREKKSKVKGSISPTKTLRDTPKSIKVKLPVPKSTAPIEALSVIEDSTPNEASSPVMEESAIPNEDTKSEPNAEQEKQSDTEPVSTTPKSNLSALKSQLLALSKKAGKSEVVQEEEGIQEEPTKSIKTEVGVKAVEGVQTEEKVDEGEQENVENEEVKVAVDANTDEASPKNVSEVDVDKSKEDGAKGAQLEAEEIEAKQAEQIEPDTKEAAEAAAAPEETTEASGSAVKKMQMTMTSFLGKQSKVIDEDAEYVPSEDKYANIREQASDEIMDIHLQATLSDCEFSSVQSSVTTDKILDAQPSLIKRTGSLIRNPLLRRNRSKKKNDMDEVIERMKHGKLAARADNNKVEEFDEKLNHSKLQKIQRGRSGISISKSETSECDDSEDDNKFDEKPKKSKKLQKSRRSRSGISISRRSETSEFDDSEDDIEEMYDFLDITDKKIRSDKIASSSYGEDLMTEGTFDDRLAKRCGSLPQVGTSAKMDVRSPTFRLSAVSGAGAGLNSPLAQQIMLNALNEQSQPKVGILRNAHLADQASAESQMNGSHSNTGSAPASSFGTFGDVVETIGLFSARLCLGTGAAIVSCSRACNDNPKSDVKQVSLDSSSFIEPNVGVFVSPRNAGATSPSVLSPRGMSPRNEIFRDGPRSPNSASNGYALALADAISKMPEEEQLDLVRQLSSKSFVMSPKSAEMNDMASSVDGMFRQRGSRMKRVPHNIAMKPKPARMEDVFLEQQHMGQMNLPSEANPAPAKKPMGRFRRGLKRLAKTRLTVMYQV